MPAPMRGCCESSSETSLSDHFSLDGVERHKLSNGLVVLVRRDRSAPVAAIVTHVNAGYFDETDDIVGVAHVLEHMFFKGTPRRGVGEISRETKASGGYLNAHTIYDHTAYYTMLPVSSLEKGFDIQSDAYHNSLIDAEELARELEVIIQEAKRKLDTASAVAVESLNTLIHDQHRIRRWRIGTEEGLRQLNRGHVHGFYQTFYRPSNTVLSIVGDAPTEQMLALAEQHYGAARDNEFPRDRGPSESSSVGFRVREFEGDIAQTQLVLGWRTPAAAHEKTPALDMLGMVLGTGRASRLYRAVRDKKLASGISASNHTPVDLGVFTVHAEVAPGDSQAALSAIWAQLLDVRRGSITDAEITRAQRILQALWLRRFESMEGQAMWLASWEAQGDWREGDEYFRRMMSLTAAEVTAVAKEYLDPDQAGIIAYRPRNAPPLADDSDGVLRLLRGTPPAPAPVKAEHVTEASVNVRRKPRLEQVSGHVRVYRSDNGVPILIRRVRGTPLFHASVHAIGGVIAEDPARAGITLLAARTAAKGTVRRNSEQLSDELELHGGFLGASVGVEGFGWSVSSPATHAGTVIDILADVVLNPTFGESSLDAERSVILGQLALVRDDMYRQPLRLALETAFANHPYGRNTLGTEKSVAGLAVADLHDWHQNNARSAHFAIAAVADIDEDELAEMMASNFASLEMREAAEVPLSLWPSAPSEAVEQRDKAQSAIALLYPSPSRLDDARFAAQVTSTIGSGLGGRFFDELRDRQSLAYSVLAYPVERRNAGAFVTYIATSPEKEIQAKNGMMREIEKLGEDGSVGGGIGTRRGVYDRIPRNPASEWRFGSRRNARRLPIRGRARRTARRPRADPRGVA